jgi:release factor glutamine methyltransferase
MTTPTTWTVGALLQWTADFFTRKAIDDPRLTAELLLAHTLGATRMMLYTQYEKIPTAEQLTVFRDLVKRRGEQVPVAYLIGKASFFAMDLIVTPDVLIPRPDTETLVEEVITRTRAGGWLAPKILDLCTGSGCVALALAKSLKSALVTAIDVSPAAVAVAEKNVAAMKLEERVTVRAGDLFEGLAGDAGVFEVIVSNPPYIPSGQIAGLMAEVRDHEPRLALDGGEDGLDLHRRIVDGARERLATGGILALEIGFDQGTAAQGLMEGAGYLENVMVVKDAGRNVRCVIGVKRE